MPDPLVVGGALIGFAVVDLAIGVWIVVPRLRPDRRGVVLALAGLVVVVALVFAFKPGSSSPTSVQVDSSQSAIDRAAEKAAKNAVAGAKAAEAVEQRLWSNGQYVGKVPPSDGVNAGVNAGNAVALHNCNEAPRVYLPQTYLKYLHRNKALNIGSHFLNAN
jgi:hypothetical protein